MCFKLINKQEAKIVHVIFLGVKQRSGSTICHLFCNKIANYKRNMQQEKIKSVLRTLFKEVVSSVNPRKLIQDNITVENRDGLDYLVVGGKYYNLLMDIFVVGFGKAVLGMARAVEEYIKPYIRGGLIIVPEGTIAQHSDLQSNMSILSHLLIFECAKHNIPDTNAQNAAQKVADLVIGLNNNSVLLVLISGGGSALLPLPVTEVSLDEVINITKMLSNAGSDILDLNCVRRKLSQLKGGKLARLAYPAQVVSLIISDVVGDPIASIASGPTCPSPDPPGLAFQVIKKYNLESKVSENVIRALTSPDDVYAPSDFDHVNNVIIGSNAIALRAIYEKAKDTGYTSLVVSDRIQGLARNVSCTYSILATNICELLSSNLNIEQFNTEFEKFQSEYKISITNTDLVNAVSSSKDSKSPLCLILGGETTVRVTGSGVGGRNQELALAFAINMNKIKETNRALDSFNVVLLSAGTDGIDGPTDVAGAFGCSKLVDDALSQGLDPCSYLENNDSYNFFAKLNNGADFIRTGHTGTNVMDVHIIVIEKRVCECKVRAQTVHNAEC